MVLGFSIVSQMKGDQPEVKQHNPLKKAVADFATDKQGLLIIVSGHGVMPLIQEHVGQIVHRATFA